MAVAYELEERLKHAPLPLVAARVKRARKELQPRISHDEIGRRMRPEEPVLRQTLINWEAMKFRPSLELLTRYAEATGRQVEWFFDPDVDPSPFPEAEAA